ncbi:CPBP family intramembrane glutamic endopeptidase [Aquipuribacter nitratireducens]|uniref:CPBP family intramembrane glutamic endopeptidase n=1 Tax=Aquipuribacter nitratireducens TaxID=650104 RepID=A0ABW0GJ38_9MICO
MTPTLTRFLVIAGGWATIVGLGLWWADVSLDSVPGVLALALLYMPSPFVAALVAERGLVRERFRLPHGGWRAVVVFLLAPAVLVVTFVGLLLVLTAAADLVGVDAVGSVATTGEEMVAGAAALLGEAAVAAAGPPPPFAVLLLAGVWGALVAGWTVNGLVAMGEEYGWRGLMWEQLRHLGPVRANLAIGAAWGLWHAPVVLQGYNYPGYPVAGVAAMVLFCVALSLCLTALRELTGSVLPVAAAHGMVNALAPLVLLVTPGAHPVLAGPLGLVGSAVLLALGAVSWALVRRRADRAVEAPVTGW